jgi:hypothetical protein
MKIKVIRNGKEENYLIDYFEISNHSEPYITLFIKPLKDLLKDTISIDLKDLQEVSIREDDEK